MANKSPRASGLAAEGTVSAKASERTQTGGSSVLPSKSGPAYPFAMSLRIAYLAGGKVHATAADGTKTTFSSKLGD
jgi:hypothetical protein